MMEEKESRVMLSSAVEKSNYKINWTVLLMVPYLWGQAQQLQGSNLPLQNKLTWLLWLSSNKHPHARFEVLTLVLLRFHSSGMCHHVHWQMVT